MAGEGLETYHCDGEKSHADGEVAWCRRALLGLGSFRKPGLCCENNGGPTDHPVRYSGQHEYDKLSVNAYLLRVKICCNLLAGSHDGFTGGNLLQPLAKCLPWSLRISVSISLNAANPSIRLTLDVGIVLLVGGLHVGDD